MGIGATTGLTYASVIKEIDDYDLNMRRKLKKLRALARVLAEEEGVNPAVEAADAIDQEAPPADD